jgi:hypothetical protein
MSNPATKGETQMSEAEKQPDPKSDPVAPAPDAAQRQSAPDPFDPENLRLGQSFIETAGVEKLLTTVPVRKPNAQDFVRVRPSLSIEKIFRSSS